MAQHDALTGLPNRVLFRSRMERAMSRAKRGEHIIALMSLDLDYFKEINDALGHGTGDKVLQNVAQCLQKQLRDVDTIARMGGVKFTRKRMLELLPLVNVPVLSASNGIAVGHLGTKARDYYRALPVGA